MSKTPNTRKPPKFVLRSEETVTVKLEIENEYLEIVTEDGFYLVSINMENGEVRVNENPRFGLTYKGSNK
jgi:hypothetical protein